MTRLEGQSPKQEGDKFQVIGDLVMRDSSMEVVLDCEVEGRGTDPWGNTRAGFSFRTEIDRRDWGLKWNQALETVRDGRDMITSTAEQSSGRTPRPDHPSCL